MLLPVLGMFVVFGRIVRARTAANEALRLRTAELRRRREETARLTVMADRARVTTDLDVMLRNRIERIAAAAIVGRETLEIDRPAALQALVSIEHDGREVLRQMREIVGTLDHGAPSEPQPSLEELPELLARTTSADTRLSVVGERRRLPAGIELAGYRIAEHLVSALDDAPGATVDVRLRFAPDALELHVSGRPAGGVDPAPGSRGGPRTRRTPQRHARRRARRPVSVRDDRPDPLSSHGDHPPPSTPSSLGWRSASYVPATVPHTALPPLFLAWSPYGVGGRWRPPAAAAGGPLFVRDRAYGAVTADRAPPLVCYALGTDTGVAAGLTGAALLSVGLQMEGGPFNPLFEMITFGPWLAGRVVRSRQELTQADRNPEPRDRGRAPALLARESVRYERGRIARELHDIVAHCISVVVVQAVARQRLAVAAPDQAAVAVDASPRRRERPNGARSSGRQLARAPAARRGDCSGSTSR